MPSDLRSSPSLYGLAGALAGREFRIPSSILIGRDASQCGIVLENAAVSRVQARIDLGPAGGATITDLASKQTTYVNGKPVTQQALASGDVIGFGPGGVVQLRFESAGGQGSGGSPGDVLALSTAELKRRLHAAAELAVPSSAAPPAPAVVLPRDSSTLHVSGRGVVRLGRAPDNDVVLDGAGVSRYHATLTYDASGRATLADAGSSNGTFLNGAVVTEPVAVSERDTLYLGGFVLRVYGHEVKRYDLSKSRLTVRNVYKQVDGRPLLHDISLAILPREFVALMGPSGCGKSTLLDALNGLRPATGGNVYINDLDLYGNFDTLRPSIGHLPQRDALHEALTVERTLHYAARLRLPAATSDTERDRVVDEVIETVGLGDHRGTPFGQLSGGQQKRLSLGLELITKPSFLFLDEPTSPLDPEATEKLMLLFRRLADEGRIVVMVTHKLEQLEQTDHVALLTRGGRLAFFGPPARALEYFGCVQHGKIYTRLGDSDPEAVSQAYARSREHQRYVADRMIDSRELPVAGLPAPASDVRRPRVGTAIRQWTVLSQRYLEIKLRDRRNTALLLLQAPIVALILVAVSGGTNDGMTLFIAAISSVWFGANNSIREIVAEDAIYRRERQANLRIPPYLLSKFAVLSGAAMIQSGAFAGILVGFDRVQGSDFFIVLLLLFVISLAGVAVGLFFSALVSSTEKAMTVLPLIVVPQLLLSGFFKPVETVYADVRTGGVATRAAYEEYRKEASDPGQGRPGAAASAPCPILKKEGLGIAAPLSAIMIARWGMDGLVHAVSMEDGRARDRLAGQLTVRGYQAVLEGKTPDGVKSRYRERVLLDTFTLAGFTLVFLGLTGWALARKDAL